MDNCTRTRTQQNGVNGTLVTGPNGNTIFLPAAGHHIFDDLVRGGSYGHYWSSSLSLGESYVYGLYFDSSEWFGGNYERYYGFSVRAVITPEKSQDTCPVAEAIDLGLPSGTKWASWNVGASAPEEYGGYYAWGETEEKDNYSEGMYKYYNSETNEYIHIGDDIAGTEYDVAHEKWGGSWRMPSLDQIQELLDICTQTWTQQNDVNGTLVTGPNGNSIFLPAAGYRWGDSLRYEGTNGHYWSSSLYPSYSLYAYSLFFGSSYWDWGYSYRYYGQSVRAVCP